METEIKRAVSELKDVVDEQERELAKHTGIETPMAKNEIENYLRQVVQEVRRKKRT